MAGLFGLGEGYAQQAQYGLQKTAQLEQERNAANEQLEAAEKAAQGQMAGTGAALGASIGAGASTGAWGGPVGALAGAAIGFLASELF